mgnify:FL=1
MNPRPNEMNLSDEDVALLNSDPVPDDRWKYYTILQVPRTASLQEIEQSYRRLSKVFHTDRLIRNLRQSNRSITQAEIDRYTASARLTMSLVNQAKAVLTDPVRRAAYDRHGDDGLAAFESLDVAVRDTSSPSEVIAMLDILKGSKRQHDTDVQLGTNGAVIALVDASEFVDAAIAKWITGTRGTAMNQLIDLDDVDLGEFAKPYVKAVTAQHVAQAYVSERVNVSVGAALQTSNGLAGGKTFASVVYALTDRDTLQFTGAITEASDMAFELGASRQIDNKTSLDAVIKHDFAGDSGPSFSVSSKRKLGADGAWVSADADFITAPVAFMDDEGNVDVENASWEAAPGGLSFSAGGVLENDASGGKKTTIQATLRYAECVSASTCAFPVPIS